MLQKEASISVILSATDGKLYIVVSGQNVTNKNVNRENVSLYFDKTEFANLANLRAHSFYRSMIINSIKG